LVAAFLDAEPAWRPAGIAVVQRQGARPGAAHLRMVGAARRGGEIWHDLLRLPRSRGTLPGGTGQRGGRLDHWGVGAIYWRSAFRQEHSLKRGPRPLGRGIAILGVAQKRAVLGGPGFTRS